MITFKIGKAILLEMLRTASVFDGGFQAVRLTAGAGKLSVSAIDLTFGGLHLETPIENKDTVEFTICVPTKTLSDTVSSGNTPEIGLQFEDEKLVVKTNAKTSIKAVDDIPLMQEGVSEYQDSGLTCGDFASAMEKVVIAASKEDNGRPSLCSVNMEFDDRVLTMVATDGLRMSKVVLATAITGKRNYMLQRSAALALSRILKDNPSPLKIGFTEGVNGRLVFKWADGYAFGFTVEGKFPNWSQIIPKSYKTRMVLNAVEFIRAVKIVRLFHDGEIPVVCLDVSFDQVNAKSLETVAGSANTTLTPVSLQGGPLEIGFNANLIPLQWIESGVEIGLNQNNSAALIQNPQENNWTYILMPVHLG